MKAGWTIKDFHSNFPMALDEADHRLFVGTWHPARLAVLDTRSGKVIADLKACGDADDLFCDPTSKRISMSCGAGFIDVFQQKDADHYLEVEKISTASGARTSLLA